MHSPPMSCAVTEKDFCFRFSCVFEKRQVVVYKKRIGTRSAAYDPGWIAYMCEMERIKINKRQQVLGDRIVEWETT